MKLRNKKTGDVWEFDEGLAMKASYETAKRAGVVSGSLTCYADSIAELNKEWEDYNPAEPLIKDEKIRKAVRVWAETNEMELSDTVHYSPGFYKFKGTYCSIDFKMPIRELECRNYTIAELCGEEEDV